MQVGIVGINHKLADLKLRETLAKVCERRFHPRYSTHGHHAFVLLSTCNRTEIYFSSSDLVETHSYLLNILRQDIKEEFDQKLYSYFGYECFYHLSRVTAGLDSACLAETEIQGQVKASYEKTHAFTKLPMELHYLFQKSLNIGKHIRRELNLGRGLPGLENAVFETAHHFFQDLDSARILFVGASAINEKILSHKRLPHIHLMTRSDSRGQELKNALGVTPVPWEPETWSNYDWIVFGSKANNYLVEPCQQNKLPSKKLVMDLSVPRNVHPLLAKDPQVTLLNIDQLNRLLSSRQKRLQDSIEKADNMVSVLSERHLGLYQQKQAYGLRPQLATCVG